MPSLPDRGVVFLPHGQRHLLCLGEQLVQICLLHSATKPSDVQAQWVRVRWEKADKQSSSHSDFFLNEHEAVTLVDFTYLVFIHMPDECYCR